jgi:hypothetical protein
MRGFFGGGLSPCRTGADHGLLELSERRSMGASDPSDSLWLGTRAALS